MKRFEIGLFVMGFGMGMLTISTVLQSIGGIFLGGLLILFSWFYGSGISKLWRSK